MKPVARFLGLILWLAIAGPAPSYAGNDDLASLPSRLTTDADERQIAGWWADPSLSSGEAERRTFELVFKRRIELLPKAVAEEVLLDRTLGVYFTATRGARNSGYEGILRQVRLRLPAELRETSSYYFALMHELEHSVQRHSRGLWKSTVEQWLDWRGLRVWIAEKEAMESEWHYLRSIPEADRIRIADELAAGPYAKEMNLEIHNHRAAGGTLEEYLRDQWSVGRYSWDELAKKDAQFRKSERWNCLRLVGIVGLATTYVGANRYCTSLHEGRRQAESPTFYRYYCQGVRNLP